MLLEKISFRQLVENNWRWNESWKNGLASSKAVPVNTLILSARIHAKFSLLVIYQLQRYLYLIKCAHILKSTFSCLA